MASPELLAEELHWIKDVLRAEMPGGVVPSAATLNRWVSTGVLTPDGTRVVLETARIGGRLATSRAAVRRFIAAQQTMTGGEAAGSVQAPASRNLAARAAGLELQAMGC